MLPKRLDNGLELGMNQKSLRDTCGRCCQWDLLSTSSAVKKIVPPAAYPKKTDSNAPIPPNGRAVGEKFLKPVKQSF